MEENTPTLEIAAPDFGFYERMGSIAGILVGALILYAALFFLLKRWAKKKEHRVAQLLQKNIYYPGFAVILTITLTSGWSLANPYIEGKLYTSLAHVLYIAIIVAIGVLLLGAINFAKEIIILRTKRKQHKDYTERKVRTKYQLLQRMLNIFVVFGIITSSLMTFEQVRQIGNTLLASAGLVGLILGFAAQKSLGTIFAGIQIALSQPIRLDDTVVVEEEFGTIGEITLTYVVVNTWDGRRIVVPINFFLENKFENWTRVSPEVVGKVKIYVDYTVPVDELRTEFQKWLDDSPLWDRQSSRILVTNATETTVEIRASMSAKNSDDAWELECQVREKLVGLLRQKYPSSLPHTRIFLEDETKPSPETGQ